MSLLAAEDALLALTREHVGNYVRQVDSLAGEFDTATMKRLVKTTPGVFWSFLGGLPDPADPVTSINARWAMYVLTGHASGQAARRRGDSREVGAYELLSILLPVFHARTLAGIGTLKMSRVDNLFNGIFERQGVALYAAIFSLPMSFDTALPAGLDDFITFHADYDVEPFTTQAEHGKWSQGDYSTTTPDAEEEDALPQ